MAAGAVCCEPEWMVFRLKSGFKIGFVAFLAILFQRAVISGDGCGFCSFIFGGIIRLGSWPLLFLPLSFCIFKGLCFCLNPGWTQKSFCFVFLGVLSVFVTLSSSEDISFLVSGRLSEELLLWSLSDIFEGL